MKFSSTTWTANVCRVALIAGACGVPARADDFVMPPGAVANLPQGVQQSIGAMAQQQANSMLNYMLLKLDEINRVCTLTGSQRIKLTVAAKGAIEYAVQDWIDTFGMQIGTVAAPNQAWQVQLGAAAPAQVVLRVGNVAGQAVDVAPANAAQAVAIARAQAEVGNRLAAVQRQQAQAGIQNAAQVQQVQQQADALAAQLQQLQQLQVQQKAAAQQFTTVVEDVVVNENGVNRVVRCARRVPVAQPNAAATAEQQHVWTSALESTLSDEQRKQLAAATAERVASQAQTTPSARLVNQIDDWLLVDPEQRAKLKVLVDQTLELPTFKVQVQRTPQLSPAIIDRIIKRIPAADMTALLSPLQMTRWQQLVQGQVAPGGGAAPAVNIIDGPAPVPVLRVQ